ncbi:MAG TPA: DNA repair protein RecN [Bryobacteraceae bacterium]|nr:DNA repair protein RecN [Bryobacteraceae bacterium]
MLVELVVENYAVIEKARVRFHRGLNLLSGETGSGKSIVVDALGLLLGARTSAEMIRTGAERARVSGIFEIAASASIGKLLDEAGIEIEDHELLVEREILANGKSRAFVGNRPATAALLKELAPYLGDIHGQHDQQQLFSPGVQREMLDAFAGAPVEEVAELYGRWRAATAELEELDRSGQEKLRLADLWSFQLKEIEAVEPKPGEDVELENDRRILRNVVRLEETANAAYASLYDAPESVTAQLGVVVKRLEELHRIDASVQDLLTTLQPATIAIEEASHALRHYLAKLEADPGRLDEVESRLAALEKLKRKYGATIDEVLVFLENARRELAQVEHSSERRAVLSKEVSRLSAAYESAAAKLTAARTDAARQLSKRVENELASLAMEKTHVAIRVEAAAWSEHGADAVEILISPNVGEEPKPLEKIASGGELSRIALALKTCTARPSKSTPRTLVFDEVDAGVGGSAAESVGRRLKKLAGSSQVLCVTHLPQIAGFADHHYYVEKHTEKGRTIATIEELSAAERTREIGRMLSGERVTPEALRHAEQLLKLAANARE